MAKVENRLIGTEHGPDDVYTKKYSDGSVVVITREEYIALKDPNHPDYKK